MSFHRKQKLHRTLAVIILCATFLSGTASFAADSGTIDEKTNSSLAAVITYSGKQLISQSTHISDSKNFAAERPVEHLWDGCTVSTPNCVTASENTSLFFVDFDFGSLYTLEAARLFADADGTYFSQTWSFEYKKESGDVWTSAFKDSDAYANGWVEKSFTGIVARYIRVTVGASRSQAAAPEARELEVYGVSSETASASPTPISPPATTTPSLTSPQETPIPGNSYIVSPLGNDSNPGTLAEPFKTPQKAVDIARAGDTVLLRAGTYTEGVIFGHSGTKEKPIIFRNFPGEKPVFDFGVTNSSSLTRRIELRSGMGTTKPISWIVIEGLELTHAPEAIKFSNAEDVIIRNNVIHDTFYSGIRGVGGSRVTITDNVIYRIGLKDLANTQSDANNHGMLITGSNYRITNNIIYDVRAHGIYIAAHQFSITQYADENFSGGKNVLIANNVIAHTRFKSGIGLWQDGVTQGKILNNIFFENAQNLSTGDTAGIEFISTGAAHTVQNNIFFNPGKLDFSPNSNGLYTESKNVDVHPLFVNANLNDFHLQAGSGAIDAGSTIPEITTDINGSLRPYGCCFDIGPYEFGAPLVPLGIQPATPTPPVAPLPTPIPVIPPPATVTGTYSRNTSLRIVGAYTVRVRKDPSLTASIVGRKSPGSDASIIEGPIRSDGYTWYKVKFTSDNLIGWAAGEFLTSPASSQRKYEQGTTITTTANVSVRDNPAGVKIGQQLSGSTGVIIDAIPVYKAFMGVVWWWKIDYATNPDGWSAQNYIR